MSPERVGSRESERESKGVRNDFAAPETRWFEEPFSITQAHRLRPVGREMEEKAWPPPHSHGTQPVGVG